MFAGALTLLCFALLNVLACQPRFGLCLSGCIGRCSVRLCFGKYPNDTLPPRLDSNPREECRPESPLNLTATTHPTSPANSNSKGDLQTRRQDASWLPLLIIHRLGLSHDRPLERRHHIKKRSRGVDRKLAAVHCRHWSEKGTSCPSPPPGKLTTCGAATK